MGTICHPLSKEVICEQIASLLNTYNDLSYTRTFPDIMNGKVDYLVETHGKEVIAVCGHEALNYQMVEIKHLVVHPSWRTKGLGSFMVGKCLNQVKAPLVYATAKSNNRGSIKIFESLGFKISCTYFNSTHEVTMLVRSNPKWIQKPNWKSVS